MLNDSWLDSVDLQIVQRESQRHDGDNWSIAYTGRLSMKNVEIVSCR
jgi:hypothetical protein